MIRKFFADTRDMVLDGLARLGLIRGGSTWWRERMRRRVDRLEADAENLRRSVRSEFRMCRECRALVPNRERTCPDCGAPMSGVPRGGASRLLSLVTPSFGSVSTSLLGAIVVIYAALAFTAPGGGSLMGLPGRQLYDMGAKWTPSLWAGEWWRIVNPVYLHASILHLAFNGMALANIGPALESAVGSRRLLVLFTVTGVFSFVASAVLSPQSLSVGASGAIFGLIGFGVVHGRRRGGTIYRAFSDDLLRWAIFGLLISIVPGIDMGAHAGGFVAGAAMGLVVGHGAPRYRWVDVAWTLATIASILLPIVGFGYALMQRQ